MRETTGLWVSIVLTSKVARFQLAQLGVLNFRLEILSKVFEVWSPAAGRWLCLRKITVPWVCHSDAKKTQPNELQYQNDQCGFLAWLPRKLASWLAFAWVPQPAVIPKQLPTCLSRVEHLIGQLQSQTPKVTFPHNRILLCLALGCSRNKHQKSENREDPPLAVSCRRQSSGGTGMRERGATQIGSLGKRPALVTAARERRRSEENDWC